MRVLVTGVNGQVGGELMALGAAGCELIAADRSVLDLADVASIERAFTNLNPDLVVNCAAYTAVDQSEDDAEKAFAINSEGPGVLATLCADAGTPMIHISTDYVFDGEKDSPYIPSDPVRPLGVYGGSKEAGEQAIRKACPKHVILRTAWVFSSRGKNFVKTMLRIGKTTNTLRVVVDQVGSPTSAHDIAEAIAQVITRIKSGQDVWGTYHFCNAGAGTWYHLAVAIFEVAERELGLKNEVIAVTTEEYPTPTKRPKNSALDTSSFSKTFGLQPRHWREALDDVVMDILHNKKAGEL